MIDFDGEKLAEKQFAQKYGVRATPTFQFFPDSTAGLKDKSPRGREVSRFQGYLQPPLFLAAFRFVAERAARARQSPGLSEIELTGRACLDQ